MLVTVTGFGSVWRARLGKRSNDPRCSAHAAYYNTTGVVVNGKIRTRPKIIGQVRFNGVGGFNPLDPSRAINRVFECAEPCVWLGQNKVLFRSMLRAPERPDYFLVAARPDEIGRLHVGAEGWKSEDTLLISFSEYGAEQEALLLVPAYGWIRSERGTFMMEPQALRPWTAELQLTLGM